MSGWIHDVTHAIRAFRRAPWFFAGLIFVLALGTGANTAIFSLVHAFVVVTLVWSLEVVIVRSARRLHARP